VIEAVRAFRCEKCGAEVERGEGGLCPGCGRLLCAHHFDVSARSQGDLDDPRWTCRDCQATPAV
jgi:hypothetical protein